MFASRHSSILKETSSAKIGALPFVLAAVTLFGLGVIFYADSRSPQMPSGPGFRQMEASAPNILLIVMDTVRADHLSAYGYERDTSPFLLGLAEEATLFRNAIAPGAMTLSTHASIFTGMPSRQHGSHLDPWNGYPVGRPLSQKFDTLAESLEKQGYLTLGVMANTTFLSPHYGLDQGFQYYHNREHTPFLGQSHPFYIRQFVRDIFVRFVPREAFDRVYCRAEVINREAFGVIDEIHNEDKPFFLFINYMDAHNPYIPPPPFDRKFPGKDDSFTSAHYYPLAIDVVKGKREVRPEEYAHLISQYDGAIAYIDSQIQSLIARLKEARLYENTLIVITSDHGEAFGDKNLFNHGCSVYQDQIHVPLIIKYPKSRQKIVVEEPVSLVDLMPTILDVSGGEIPSSLTGKSLIRPSEESGRPVVSETYPSGYLIGHNAEFDRIEYALFAGPHKLIRSTKGKKELFHLLDDPHESRNIISLSQGRGTQLDATLGFWLESTISESESSAEKTPDKETLERLRSLGYIK
jgi:arylsulfatase A-like enzyme